MINEDAPMKESKETKQEAKMKNKGHGGVCLEPGLPSHSPPRLRWVLGLCLSRKLVGCGGGHLATTRQQEVGENIRIRVRIRAMKITKLEDWKKLGKGSGASTGSS